jgi:hypothetical protein
MHSKRSEAVLQSFFWLRVRGCYSWTSKGQVLAFIIRTKHERTSKQANTQATPSRVELPALTNPTLAA